MIVFTKMADQPQCINIYLAQCHSYTINCILIKQLKIPSIMFANSKVKFLTKNLFKERCCMTRAQSNEFTLHLVM